MRLLAMIAALVIAGTPAWTHSLKVATWNIEHPRDGFGEGHNPRDQADFDRPGSTQKS